MKKFIFPLFFVLLLVGCSQSERTLDDELQLELQHLNEEEVKMLLHRNGNFTKEEIEQYYAVLVFDYRVRNGNKFRKLAVQRDFDMDLLMDQVNLDYGRKYMNENGGGEIFRNGSFKRDWDRFIFYAKDFSAEQLQDIFETYKLNISWTDSEGHFKEQTIFAGQNFQDRRGE
ncbi:membrane lipoprotein lipid attachment site-containing protein [Solibacillus sp. MA9]|uniref:Membrane lipoprotein lipid attachment site-containing protein n=1 Tax=Solibacillus palustris TaxID=2908203 RepID=A0ABS9UH82_9BACL|nr:membrane lipoprotein lipid attachment site-containing protein [Solibacillus sp. MA9]MCH7323318.1 membrane lipoprotein lipid attachment site-containing protein [Solibacillus sp. MA9]